MGQKKLATILVIVSIGSLFLASQFPADRRSGNMRSSIVAYAQGGGTTIFLPSIMKYPTAATSHYMQVSFAEFNSYTLGQADAQIHQSVILYGDRIMFVLAWGQPCKFSSTEWGAYSYDSNCHSISALQTQIQNYLIGYCTKMQSLWPGSPGKNCGYQYNTQAVPVIMGWV
jgi:hypothetical protein